MTDPTPTSYGPRELLVTALAERRRRQQASNDLSTGAWAYVTDSALQRELGENIVRIESAPDAATRRVTTMWNKAAAKTIARSKLRACLAVGDRVTTSSGVGVIATAFPNNTQTLVRLLSTGGKPTLVEGPEITSTSAITSNTPGSGPTVSPSTIDYKDPLEFHVRGTRGSGADGVGPSLSHSDFLAVAVFGEMCSVRMSTTSGSPIAFTGPGGERAVIADFIGGATLLVWESLLGNNIDCRPWNDLVPSAECRIPTSSIPDPFAPPRITAKPTAVKAPSLPSAPTPVPALTSGNSMTTAPRNPTPKLDKICELPAPARDAIYVVGDDYDSRVSDILNEIRRAWTGTELEDIERELCEIGDEDQGCGAFKVSRVRTIDLPDGRVFVAAMALKLSDDDSGRYLIVPGCAQHAGGGSLAISDGSAQPGIMARVTKSVTSGAMNAVKDGAVGAKNAVIDEVKRKGMVLAQEGIGESVVATHVTVRNFILGAAAGLTGGDPANVAANKGATQVYDVATKALGRGLAAFLEKSAPGLAKTINATIDNLEHRLDQHDAQGVLDVVAPVAGNMVKAIAGRAAQSFSHAPALPAPAPSMPALEAAPADKPKRVRKPKAASETDAPKTAKPRASRAKKTTDGAE